MDENWVTNDFGSSLEDYCLQSTQAFRIISNRESCNSCFIQ